MNPLTIEAKLAPDIKADVDFTVADAPDGPEVMLWGVTPFGIVPAISDRDLWDLAAAWLDKGGGNDACCRLAEEKGHGGFEQ